MGFGSSSISLPHLGKQACNYAFGVVIPHVNESSFFEIQSMCNIIYFSPHLLGTYRLSRFRLYLILKAFLNSPLFSTNDSSSNDGHLASSWLLYPVLA